MVSSTVNSGLEPERGQRTVMADLFVVQTMGFRVLFVFFFIAHDRREVLRFNVTASPTAAWVWQQVVETTPWGKQPKHLIHDRGRLSAGSR